MPTATTSNATDALDALELDDLYAQLAIAEAGTEPDSDLALASVSEIHAMMSDDSGGAADFAGGLIGKGRKIFNRYWPAVKGAVCKVWDEHGTDYLDKAADVVSTLLRLPKAIIKLILKIAFKLGMDLLCAKDASPQPA